MASSKPTAAELAILRVLWIHGPSTVRAVHEALRAEQSTGYTAGYTTVLKLLQIMRKKGRVVCDTANMAHVYRPAASEAETQADLVKDLLDGAFYGSTRALVLRALSMQPSTPEELAEIRQLIEELEREG
ncbi:MAG: BlaI/MecI/CopY family transcriptional regulator [Rhodothermales bacterium]|nr:BlaI/MecI/CopY family transcriptional regulator [Rhodothermales bacterium]